MTLLMSIFFFFNDTATTEIYTLSLHDALPISRAFVAMTNYVTTWRRQSVGGRIRPRRGTRRKRRVTQHAPRSEEHTSELQSRQYLVCRLLLEKKKKTSTVLPQTTGNAIQHVQS